MEGNDQARRGSWGWPLILAVTIFFASGAGTIAAPDWFSYDKLAHLLVFGLLGLLIARTQPRSRWWLGVLLASLYGIADEYRQSFTPGRYVEFDDWVADTVGAALAVTLYARWELFRNILELNLRSRSQPQVAKSPASVPDEN
jgi:VanZ family protein